MLWLSDEAIEYAVAKCRHEQGYRVTIAVPNRNRVQEIDYALRSHLRDTDEFRARRGGGLTIEFHNGSYIKVLTASDNARGYRVHLLIADEDIDDEIISCVLRPYETLEHLERQRRRYAENLRTEFRYVFRNCETLESVEYLSCPMEPTGLWEREFFNTNDDKDFADVSEEEFMNILNTSTKEKKEYE